MDAGVARGIRIATVLLLLVLVTVLDPLPAWWWVALALMAGWSALEYRKEDDDD